MRTWGAETPLRATSGDGVLAARPPAAPAGPAAPAPAGGVPPAAPAIPERVAREARIVGLGDVVMPSFEAVERRRFQLWTLSSIVLVLLAATVLISIWSSQGVGRFMTPLILRTSVVLLALGFCIYCMEKEVHLRRLGAMLIEERMLSTALSNRVKELTLLLEAGKAMNSGLALDGVLESILRSALELLEAASGSIMLVDHGELRVVIAFGNDGAKGARLAMGEGVAGTVAATGEPLLISGPASAERFPGLAARAQAVDSAMCCPLIHRDELLGVVNVNAPEARHYSEYDLRALALFAEQAASTIAAGRLYEAERANAERLAHMAFHDPLTGLANRMLFVDRARHALARAARHPGAVGVMFVDLDRFKFVNDSFGHSVGDELLSEVAHRLRMALRPSDTLARFGGDEFVVLCDGLAGEIEAVGLASRLIEALSEPFHLSVGEVTLSASAGIALASGPDDDPNALLRDADTAMYRAKEAGRGRYEVFNGAMRLRATERLRVENCLRHGLANGWLRLDYQPVVDLVTGEVLGAEALVRLDDPDRGQLLPADFIGVAEDSRLILQLGNWVIAEASRQAAAWLRSGLLPAHGSGVSVNLSSRQLADPDLAATVAHALSASGLDPSFLAVEIGEPSLADAPDDVFANLATLSDLGVRLGIDDFGSGYAALATLRRFPVDFVKIDQSFVQGLDRSGDDQVIVEAVLNLGRALKLDVVAKGVEAEEQADRLRQLGCQRGQGWHLGLPVPPQAFELRPVG